MLGGVKDDEVEGVRVMRVPGCRWREAGRQYSGGRDCEWYWKGGEGVEDGS